MLRVASPTKFIEYLAFAKPTVGNHHPEHSMIAECEPTGRIVERSPQGFADAILWCLDHPEEARAMALSGRAVGGRNRTYDRLADMVHAELREMSGTSVTAGAGRAVAAATAWLIRLRLRSRRPPKAGSRPLGRRHEGP